MFDKLFKKNIQYNKILMLNAPSFNIYLQYPYLSVPLLTGQLRKFGFNVYSKDFAFDFFSDLSQKKYIKKTYNKIKKLQKKYGNSYQTEFEKIFKLYETIKKNISTSSDIDEIKKISLLTFFNFPYSFFYKHIYSISNDSQNIPINDFFSNKNINFYLEFLEEKIKTLPSDVDIICISKVPDFELSAILTLAKLLKEKYKNKKIVLGGYWFSFIADELLEHPEFFDIFCDFIMIGDGEFSLIELIEHIYGQRDINEVSNVIYKNKNNKIIKNDFILQLILILFNLLIILTTTFQIVKLSL